MKTIDPKDVNPVESLQLLTAAIAPRPIALVSTVSVEGQHNLAPFSFFNAVGSNPPYIVFSPSRRARDGSLKDTYYNLAETGECVVHVVNHALVWQMNIASGEYDRGINEFEKAGFTPIDSQKISPKRIKESPIHMECELVSMTQLGGLPGSGNMALCRVLLFHVDEALYSENGLSVERIHHVGRNGA
ncbi:MAG: flavin reductase family protein, partial [Bdellovibrionales bacterium]|nr:flavin reductase family protein [Bdellovibrionales bacterium]